MKKSKNLKSYTKKDSIFKAIIDGDILCIVNNIDYIKNNELSDSYGLTPLHNACYFGKYEITEFLLLHYANVNAKDFHSRTPLHLACFNDRNKEIVELLIEYNANINATCKLGRTPLHIACSYDCVNIVQKIIKHGGLTNITDIYGNKPLGLSSDRMAKFILTYKSIINFK